MTKCWINFRIHEDATYAERYSSLVAKIEERATLMWDGTTSFYIVKQISEQKILHYTSAKPSTDTLMCFS